MLGVNQENEKLMEDYETLASEVRRHKNTHQIHSTHCTQTHITHTYSIYSLAVGVDQTYHSLAGESCAGEDHVRDAAEAGGFPRLPQDAQTSQSAGEVSTGDQLQHPAD